MRSLSIVSALFFMFFFATPFSLSSAAADQPGYAIIFVANNGSDMNQCSQVTTPCATLKAALTQVYTGGVIRCLSNPQDLGIVNITTSVTINCAADVYGYVKIDLPTSDTKQAVLLRGMTLYGLGQYVTAVQISNGKSVVLEDMTILESSLRGVLDQRTTAGKLTVKNTAIRHTGGPGLVVAGAGGNIAILDNVTSSDNTYGLAVAAGNYVSVIKSVVSGNSTAGVEADGGSLVIVDGSTISGNNIGVQSGSAVRLSNNNIEFNTTGVNGATGTFGNNRFSGNTSDGTALTPVGAGSTDLAQK